VNVKDLQSFKDQSAQQIELLSPKKKKEPILNCLIQVVSNLSLTSSSSNLQHIGRVVKFHQKLGVRSQAVRGGALMEPRPPILPIVHNY